MTDLVQKIADYGDLCFRLGFGHGKDMSDSTIAARQADVSKSFDAIRAALADAGGAVAWLTEDGERCVTARTMAGARKDGGAILSSLSAFTVPAFAHPDSGRVAELEAQLAHVTALHRNAAQTLDVVLETRRSVERELAESREREGRMREAVEYYMQAWDDGMTADGAVMRKAQAALAADKEKNDE